MVRLTIEGDRARLGAKGQGRLCVRTRRMNVPLSALGLAALVSALSLAAGCADNRPPASPPRVAPDSAAAATAAMDTLQRLRVQDYVIDSVVRHADTAAVWVGPRIWAATDRPTSVISIMAPGRVVGIRHIPGG